MSTLPGPSSTDEVHPDIPVLGPLTGSWSWNVEHDRWWWSAEMYVIHGYKPGDVVPTTELLLGHKHPDDREKCRAVLTHALEHGGQVACPHRLVDAQRRTRQVLQVGSAHAGPEGTIVELTGYLVDLTTNHAQPPAPGRTPAAASAFGLAIVHEDWLGQSVGLTRRESQILELVTSGLSNQEIADTTYISINSVKTYIRTLYRRIEVTSRSQAVRYGMENGFDQRD